MPDLLWPKGLVPYKVMFYLRPHVGGQQSPLTRTRKVYGLSAPIWVARLTFRAGHGYDDQGLEYRFGPSAADVRFQAALLDALIAEMEGGLTAVRFHDFRRPRPQSYLTRNSPAITVDAAPAGSTEITINRAHGLIGPSIGDYIGGDGRPHIVTDVSPKFGSMMSAAGPDGKIQVKFKPPLSTAIAQDAALEMDEVTAPFQLITEDAGGNESEVGQLADYVLEFEEKLP
ncbi:hypothetical protein CP98_04988 [Sphingobium yanoikuyae]|uniref:Uncharacterized protein n=2 Tax=Sphingobium yanoikuyae TaxID=13690 RepID=A0A084E6E1_SPHYA|nr:hypothetical protein CP98_04988 [Sphingobium yanoikuyae]